MIGRCGAFSPGGRGGWILRATQAAPAELKHDELAGLIELFRNAPEVEDIEPPVLITLIRMLRIVSRMRRQQATISASFGLVPGDLDILYVLQRSQATTGPRVTDLAANLGVTPGGISKRIDRLEAVGLVRRVDAKDDRRAWRISLTEQGAALVLKARKLRRADINHALSDEEWALLDQLLLRVSDAYDAVQAD
jgi:DNA-binding MarR family transcriptional regulator